MDLPFRLVGMTTDDLLNGLYLDDEYASLPSDSESVSENERGQDSDNEEILVDNSLQNGNFDVIEAESDESDVEMNVPLSIIRQNLLAANVNNETIFSKTFQQNDTIKLFTGPSGAADFVKELNRPSPTDLFLLLFSEDLIDKIVFHTNLYATQRAKPFRPTTLEEMKTFIGINILMGIKKLPSYRDYWSTSPMLHDNYISSLIPVKRFSWILSHLHFNDNNLQPQRGDPSYDKLYKIRPVIDELQKKFWDCYLPSQNLSIDESMIRFKGRSSMKQYMPKKPIKRGYKVWMLADNSGYCLKFDVYTGKSVDGVERDLGTRVVKNLCRGLENKGHCVYFDNYFTNVDLLEFLRKYQIYACGTVNKTRKKIPVFIADKQMKRGEYEHFVSNTGLLAVKWMDKRSVHLLSNFHRSDTVSTVKRKNKDGTVEEIPCPEILIDYNRFMNAVDKFDQLKSVYEINRKSHKWYHRIFFYLVDACVVNANRLYEDLKLPKILMKDFRLSIADGIITKPSKKRTNNITASPVQIKKHKPFVPEQERTNSADHQPEYGSRRRCALCSTKKKQIRTNWLCRQCNVPLCLSKSKNCFETFHT